jgi:hypothetical protein
LILLLGGESAERTKDLEMRRMIIDENFGKIGFQMDSKSC